MRIFVTGGSGFVGRHLLRRLVSTGHQVHALARTDSAADLVRREGAVPVLGDLSDLLGSDRAPRWTAELNGVEAVVHGAAHMAFWGPDAFFRRANLEPSVALHRVAAASGVTRFVLISAASVASGTQRAPVVDERTDEGRPNIAYSRVKLDTERSLLGAGTPTMTTVALRPPFIWGAGMSTLGDFVATVDAGRFSWIDNGRHTVDFVHVDNLAEAIRLALSRGRAGHAYYVTDGTPMSARDFFSPLLATRGVDVSAARSVPLAVAAPLAAMLDAGARLLRRPEPPMLTNWITTFMGRDRSYDITAARRELGYIPSVTLADGLAEMAESLDR
ncbi:3-beta hydroxysteroid dehydrogenase [Mycolicibacterium murale]|uniref:3-beta hydroxysteroid dehydrogenase n=1 Tax=Mycolicibacterium murale TaxID=182220 RepID=A0A7I9WW50_9MYCO|nr:NAD(P)-dependent oxidoreductase [Mycolicibacterium murale]MCV7185030.1 NAD(P)-dependent oxidoreductase [Mycolicibacterium murale]GFG61809.1 3-beta hydroxysteroid dehydrogenase [Mycolicibacterium murale]